MRETSKFFKSRWERRGAISTLGARSFPTKGEKVKTTIGLAIAFVIGLAIAFVIGLAIVFGILGVLLVLTGNVGVDEWGTAFGPILTTGGAALVVLGALVWSGRLR